MLKRFWNFYNKYLPFNTSIAAFLFSLQLVHLYWLTTNVVLKKLIGVSFFDPKGFWEIFILVVDYTEIPALVTTSLVYLNELRKSVTLKALLFLVFLNLQWVHIFWITDEFVISHLFSNEPNHHNFPDWYLWTAILIDYLELPVIFETIKISTASFFEKINFATKEKS